MFYEISVYKNAWVAFSVDCYSHTPFNGGAMQPVMTGQVKAKIIARYSELGDIIKNGTIEFNPWLVVKSEYLQGEDKFNVISVTGERTEILMSENSLGYTICQVPIIYLCDGGNYTELFFADKTSAKLNGLMITKPYADKIFKRTGEIGKVEVHI